MEKGNLRTAPQGMCTFRAAGKKQEECLALERAMGYTARRAECVHKLWIPLLYWKRIGESRDSQSKQTKNVRVSSMAHFKLFYDK
jgi:hypothetical protein